MSTFAFVNYSRFLDQSGTPTIYAYQNFSINQSRTYSGVTYAFAPFGYTLGAGSRGGDRSDSSLVAGLDPISVNLFAEAVDSRWLLEVKTVSLNPADFSDDVLVRTELWRIAQYEMDTERIVLKLSSPLDATKNDVPRRRPDHRAGGCIAQYRQLGDQLMNWKRWIGLPHEFGADPEDGKAADCVLMVWRILDDAGIEHPAFDQCWLDMAQQKRWAELETMWNDATIQLEHAEPNAVTLFRNGPAGLGVGIVVDDGLLLVHHRRGVRWVPLSYMPSLRFYTFR